MPEALATFEALDTPSEQRVAELAASGMTNRDVAAEPFISPKTVEANRSRVYDSSASARTPNWAGARGSSNGKSVVGVGVDDDTAQVLAFGHVGVALVDLLEAIGSRHEFVELEVAGAVQVQQLRYRRAGA
jgi:hypothetical protein